ncbi:MAG TPA: hypothetical protein VN915_01495 [Elusimicrobiota bacterium]|nr:hypothetical protein [Elusimicrobiota bacterium]
MKRLIPIALAALMLAKPALPAIVHGGGGGRGGSGGGMSRGSFGGGMGHAPSSGGAMRSIGTTRAAAPSPRAMNSGVVHNSAVVNTIAARQNVESIPGRTFVHNAGGRTFFHFHSRDRINWWGFWLGPSFFWFPYYYNYWWWYDPSYARWDYWYGGHWWWYGPGGVTYIYVDNAYVPYDQYAQTYAPAQEGSASMPAPPSTPPQTPPASAEKNAPTSPGGTWKSPDGKRMVQINGAAGGAFLFDQTKSPPSLIKHLGDGAENVRFSGGKSGPTKILVDYKDGSFHLYDQNGQPAD